MVPNHTGGEDLTFFLDEEAMTKKEEDEKGYSLEPGEAKAPKKKKRRKKPRE